MLELLNRIKVESNLDSVSYVYYNKETGKIHKVSSRHSPTTDYSILEVPTSQAEPITSGVKHTDDYRVMFDLSTKTISLKEISRDNRLTINDKLYRIPELEIADLCISKTADGWEFKLSDEIRTFFILHPPAPITGMLQFSITSYDDPNILYRTLIVDLSELVISDIKIPFQYDFEKSNERVSVYTRKYFQSYGITVT